MKKLTALLLALILGLALAAPALAIEAQYDNTKVFTTMLDDMNVPYTITGIDDDKDEGVKIQDYNDLISYTIFCFFSEDNETVSFRIWNFAEYDILNRAQALEAVNNLNARYKFASWYADESDNSFNLRMDVIVRKDAEVREITLEALLRLINILKDGYPMIEPLAVTAE